MLTLKKHKIKIIVGGIVIVIISIFMMFYLKSLKRDKMIKLHDQNKKVIIDKVNTNKKIPNNVIGTFEVVNKIEKIPLLSDKYNKNGKNNNSYYNSLNYGVVFDENETNFNEIGNVNISGHNYSYLLKLKTLSLNDTIVLKVGKKTYKYRVHGKRMIDKSDYSKIYFGNEKTKDLVIFTCESSSIFDEYNPSKRLVYFARQIINS